MEKLKTYRITEAMEILQVTRRTIYNYIKAGQLKAFKAGRDWRITEDALKDFMDHGTEIHYLDKL